MVRLWNDESAQWRVELETEKGEALSLRTGAQGCVLIVNLGEKPTAELARRGAAKAVKAIQGLGADSAVLDAKAVEAALGAEGVAALAQGAALACYRQESWKAKKEEPFSLYLTGTEDAAALGQANVLTRAVCFARDLTNRPANKLTPVMMAGCMARAARAVGVEVQVLDENETRALGMEAFHAVGDSSANPPRLIVLRWKGGRPEQAPIALVGKGVCFDSGGYNLKTGLKSSMTSDMAGGAAVCGAILALAENKIPVNAVAVIPAVENRICGSSMLPSFVIGSMSGKTIEIDDTDAEGRLILADAVTYAIQKEGAGRVVDIATLTGACVRALGFTTAGLVTNNEELYGRLMAAARRSGEQYWRLPDFPEYKKMIESPVADLMNTSTDGCGAITAGLFIGAFAEDVPWIHLDIAGTSWADRPRREYQTKGATGAGVTTLYELCRGLAYDA